MPSQPNFNIPKIMNHHYLPEFYTKTWLNNLGHLLYYWAPHKKIVSGFRPPSALGCKENLYAKRDVPNQNKHSLETDVYGRIDRNAANVVVKMIDTGIHNLIEQDKIHFGTFLHSLGIRHEKQVNRSVIFADEISLATKQRMSNEQKIYFDKEIKNFEKNLHIYAMEELSTPGNMSGLDGVNTFNNALNSLTWWVEDFSETRFTLLTSDSPLIVFPINSRENQVAQRLGQEEKPSLGRMLATRMFAVFFPLSPSVGFFAANRHTDISLTKTRLIKQLNLDQTKRAKKFVIAADRLQEKFIQRHLVHLINMHPD